ncbi:MAG: DUF1295 domain-containing protein [Oxalobacteraceae bacterium]|nr:MAG: DUF1295 domain-containing protein [Oxalobacteraceae bacterium]
MTDDAIDGMTDRSMSGSSLPILHRLSDAAVYSIAVEPFLPQFNEIERVLYGEISLWTYFKETNPFVLGLHLCLCWTLFTLTASILTENWSWTDRFWSITPTSYVTLLVVWATISDRSCPRLLLFWSLHVLWSVRLTHNYHRKGGYARGSEDYRWRVLSDRMGMTAFCLLQLVYIPVQNLLVAAINHRGPLFQGLGLETGGIGCVHGTVPRVMPCHTRGPRLAVMSCG